MDTCCSELRADLAAILRSGADNGSPTAFKCTASAAEQAVDQVLRAVRCAQTAAVSLGQRERMTRLGKELEALSECFDFAEIAPRQSSSSDQRKRLGGLIRRFVVGTPGAAEAPGWREAFAELIHALDSGSVHLQTLAVGQPAGAPSRALAEKVAQLLAEHREGLSGQVDRWLY